MHAALGLIATSICQQRVWGFFEAVMTINSTTEVHEIDFFALHNRRKKHIAVEMLDYDYVDKSTDLDELKGILAMLRAGKEGRYPQLERHTEDRILALLPERERVKIQSMRSGPSPNEQSAATEDLRSWASTINAKNQELQQRKSSSARPLPPVRGQQQPVMTSDQSLLRHEYPMPAQQSKFPREKQAIPAYDFRAWEKYDVDKALGELDKDEQRAQEQARQQRERMEKRERERRKELASLPSYVDLESLSATEREVSALHEKQKGNECFKVQENEEAVLYYTRSMAFDDSNAVVYANRAMAHLRMKSFALAEQDCSRAIDLDATYVKAWMRRGMTRFRRGKYDQAVADFEQALALEPGNKEVEKLLLKTRSKWQETDGTISLKDATTSDRKAPVAAEAPEQKEANGVEEPKFTRFEIIEDEDNQEEEEEDVSDDEDDDDTYVAPKPFQRFEIVEE